MASLPLLVLLLVIIAFATADKVCPGYGFIRPPDKCESTCSPDKDECGNGKKCCFRIEQPCGHHCIVPKDNVQKAGKCPSPDSEQDNPDWGLCDGHMCDVDNDCSDVEKCCSNMCGSSVCIVPEFL